MWRTDSFEKTLMLGKIEGGGEGDDRGWDGWMASLTQWTWVWATSGSWWWTGKPGVLQSTGLQRVRHDWVTELNWTELGRKTKEYWGASQVGKELDTTVHTHTHVHKRNIDVWDFTVQTKNSFASKKTWLFCMCDRLCLSQNKKEPLKEITFRTFPIFAH